MFIKQDVCDLSYNSCKQSCRYCRPDVLCLHLISDGYYICDKCNKWIDEWVEEPTIIGEKHYHEKCAKEVNGNA